MSLHSIAHCHDCPAEWDEPDADRRAHLHTTSKAAGHTRHATASSTHPESECARVHPAKEATA